MNYKDFFKKQDVLAGGNFRCEYYREGGVITPEWECRYPMVIVLEGALVLEYAIFWQCVSTDNFVAMDSKTLKSCKCERGTVLLFYFPTPKLSEYFVCCCRAFRKPVSNIVPILPNLRQWIDTILLDLSKNISHPDSFYQSYNQELANHLMQYPHHLLGELYVPFYIMAHTLTHLDLNFAPNPPEQKE
jgi:hypothetical protein